MIALGCTSMTPHSYPNSPRRAEMVDVLDAERELRVALTDAAVPADTRKSLVQNLFGATIAPIAS